MTGDECVDAEGSPADCNWWRSLLAGAGGLGGKEATATQRKNAAWARVVSVCNEYATAAFNGICGRLGSGYAVGADAHFGHFGPPPR